MTENQARPAAARVPGAALVPAGSVPIPAASHAVGESLSVDQPLNINAFRGGSWISGGPVKDGYRNGSATKADLGSITAQAKRLTRPPRNAQYQMLVTDIHDLNGGQPSNTTYPCDNGDHSNWLKFVDATVGAAEALGRNSPV